MILGGQTPSPETSTAPPPGASLTELVPAARCRGRLGSPPADAASDRPDDPHSRPPAGGCSPPDAVTGERDLSSRSHTRTHAAGARPPNGYRTHTASNAHGGYNCSFCNKYFSSRSNMVVHERTHTHERPYTCDHCGRTFSQHGQMVIHVRSHTGQRPYTCDHCEKAFTSSKVLKIHIRTHTGEKPYGCEHCAKRFAAYANLVVHRRIHTKVRPYKCAQCDRTFEHGGNLQRHARVHAPAAQSEPGDGLRGEVTTCRAPVEPALSCRICRAVYNTATDLLEHRCPRLTPRPRRTACHGSTEPQGPSFRELFEYIAQLRQQAQQQDERSKGHPEQKTSTENRPHQNGPGESKRQEQRRSLRNSKHKPAGESRQEHQNGLEEPDNQKQGQSKKRQKTEHRPPLGQDVQEEKQSLSEEQLVPNQQLLTQDIKPQKDSKIQDHHPEEHDIKERLQLQQKQKLRDKNATQKRTKQNKPDTNHKETNTPDQNDSRIRQQQQWGKSEQSITEGTQSATQGRQQQDRNLHLENEQDNASVQQQNSPNLQYKIQQICNEAERQAHELQPGHALCESNRQHQVPVVSYPDIRSHRYPVQQFQNYQHIHISRQEPQKLFHNQEQPHKLHQTSVLQNQKPQQQVYLQHPKPSWSQQLGVLPTQERYGGQEILQQSQQGLTQPTHQLHQTQHRGVMDSIHLDAKWLLAIHQQQSQQLVEFSHQSRELCTRQQSSDELSPPSDGQMLALALRAGFGEPSHAYPPAVSASCEVSDPVAFPARAERLCVPGGGSWTSGSIDGSRPRASAAPAGALLATAGSARPAPTAVRHPPPALVTLPSRERGFSRPAAPDMGSVMQTVRQRLRCAVDGMVCRTPSGRPGGVSAHWSRHPCEEDGGEASPGVPHGQWVGPCDQRDAGSQPQLSAAVSGAQLPPPDANVQQQQGKPSLSTGHAEVVAGYKARALVPNGEQEPPKQRKTLPDLLPVSFARRTGTRASIPRSARM